MKIIILLFFCIALFSTVSASLGTFKQNECVNVVTVLNATSVTLTNVNYPAPNSSTSVLLNQPMTANGNYFNYTFCNTSLYGVYNYGYCDNAGNCYGNTFTINGSGQEVSGQQVTLIIIGIVVMIIVCGFFFIMSMLFKHPGTKIFFMALSSVTIILVIGIIASNATIYLAEFPSLVSIYTQYYIIAIILAGVAMMGVIVWLVYYSVRLFNKSRGRIDDD